MSFTCICDTLYYIVNDMRRNEHTFDNMSASSRPFINQYKTNYYYHVMCSEGFTVRRGYLKMVSVDIETLRSSN